MSHNEIGEPSNVLEAFDGQKFTVRGVRKSLAYGVEAHSHESLSSNNSKIGIGAIPNQQSLGSISTRAIDLLPGKSSILQSFSKSKLNTSYDHNQFDTNLIENGTQTLRYLKTTNWDKEHWVNQVKVFNDHADISEHPSYTIKNVAYHLECELLYMEAKEKYDSQFLREMQYYIDSKDKIADQYYSKRILSYTTLWPPLHTRRELDIFNRRFFQLSPAERKRVDYLMTTELSEI
ncbi:hypothetical protein ACLKA7_008992 [Drosophila subpalustris]